MKAAGHPTRSTVTGTPDSAAVPDSWRCLDGHELLPLVRAGVNFRDGVRVERDDGQVTVRVP